MSFFLCCCFFFFKQKTAYEMRISDWSSDVCSSDLIPSRVWAKATMGSKTRSAHEPHPGEYASEGFLDLVQMDHTKGDVILVDSLRREQLGRPWITFLIEIWTRSILGYYVSF